MKRIITLIIAVVVILVCLCGCFIPVGESSKDRTHDREGGRHDRSVEHDREGGRHDRSVEYDRSVGHDRWDDHDRRYKENK